MSKIINIENILKYFFEEPNRWYHVREAARLIKLNPTTISKYLNNLTKENILIKKLERKHLLFKANTESEEFRDLKKYYNIRLIKKSGLINYINKELHYPEAIIIFGSYAKSENDKDSDLDIFIISNTKKKLDLQKYEKVFQKEIQMFLHTPEEFKDLQRNNKHLINNVLNGIIIKGYLEVFK